MVNFNYVNIKLKSYFNKKFCATKHMKFCTKIISDGYTYPFESLLEKCDNIKTLNTTKIISKKILSIIKQ